MSPSRRTSTAAAARWRPSWSSAARCAPATRSSPARPSAASAPCSTSTATPSRRPARRARCMVLGLTSVPGAGDNFLVVPEDRVARQIAERRSARERNARAGSAPRSRHARGPLQVPRGGRDPELNLILKGDVSGSVEALEDALLKHRRRRRGVACGSSTAVSVRSRERRQPRGRVRAPSSSASTSGRPSAARELARPRGRRRPVLLGHLPGDRRHRGGPQGHAQAGVRGGSARHRRGARGVPVLQVRQHRRLPGPLGHDRAQLQGAARPRRRRRRRQPHRSTRCKRFKDDATEVREGFECGIGLGSFNDIKVDDVIETFEMREKPRA